ncbi:MAG: ATP-binding protein, partial [Mucilaginibacter sp.]|nr:ATP-binding protein [Mucilaginibacter sp.]
MIKQDPHYLNALDLLAEIKWFEKVLQTRLKLHANQDGEYNSIYDIEPPHLEENQSVFSEFLNFYKLTFDERLILVLALLPHVAPQLLDIFLTQNNNGRADFGGIKG